MELFKPKVWFQTVAAILFITFAARFINPSIGYGNGWGCDSWYFFGIDYDYSSIKMMLASSAYQLYRYPALIPWIHIGPHVSSAVLHDVKFWSYLLVASSCFSFSTIVLFGPRIGPLLGILFACSTLVLGTFSTDYVTGAGLAWECAVIATTLYGASGGSPARWGMATGAFYAMCVFTHIPMVMFTFSLPLLFLSTSRHPHKMQAFLNYNMWGLLGFALATVLMGVYSLTIGNNFLFFWDEFRAAILALQPNYYQRPISDNWTWFTIDTNIPLFLSAVGISANGVVRLLLRAQASNLSRLLPPMLAFLLVAVLCFSWEFAGRMILQEGVFAPWMYPPAFLALGSGLAMATPMSWRMTLVTLLGAMAILLAAASHSDIGAPYQIRFGVAALAFLFCALAFTRLSVTPAAISIIALVCITYPFGYGEAPWRSTHGGEKAVYEDVRAAHAFVRAHATGQKPVFWISYDAETLGSPSYTAVATPRSFLECAGFPASFPAGNRKATGGNSYFPDLKSAVASGYIKAGQRLFIIASGTRLAEDAASPLASVGLVGRLVAQEPIDKDVSIAAIDLELNSK